MLLQLLPPAVVRCRYPELQSLPADGEIDILRVHILPLREIQRVRGRLLLRLVFGYRGAARRRLPGNRDDLDRIALERLGGRDGEFLGDYGDLLALLRHDVLEVPRHGDGACDLEEVPPVARQLRGRGLHVVGRGPGRLGEEEHAVQLGRHGYGDAAHGEVEQGVGDIGEGEAEQLVVALDVGALRLVAILVGVDRVLVAAQDVGEGVLVGGGEALEGRVLGDMVGIGGVFAPAEVCQQREGGHCQRDTTMWNSTAYPTKVSAS